MSTNRLIVHLPRWLRWSLLFVLALLVIGFSVSIFIGVGRADFTHWLPPSVAIVQIALTAMAYVVLLFFTESSQRVESLKRQSDRVLTRLLPDCLQRVADQQGERVSVQVGEPSGIVGRAYDLATPHARLRMWVGLNVQRVVVAYFCELPFPEEPQRSLDYMKEKFAGTLSGARSVGYGEPNLLLEEIDGHRFASMWLTWNLKDQEDFLTHTPSQLFFAQDIALMTQSFLRSGQRHGIVLSTPFEPMPL